MEEVLLVDARIVRAWIEQAGHDITENKDHLTHLDAAIGDADHGINLVRGFDAAVAVLAEKSPDTPGAVLTTVGGTLISKVGGASGPLYGTAFRRAGKAMGTETDVSAELLGAALQAALDGVTGLGAASEGDQDDGRRTRAGGSRLPAGADLRRGRAGSRSSRCQRCGCGCRSHDSHAGVEGAGQLSRSAQRRAPRPGCDVDGSAAGSNSSPPYGRTADDDDARLPGVAPARRWHWFAPRF